MLNGEIQEVRVSERAGEWAITAVDSVDGETPVATFAGMAGLLQFERLLHAQAQKVRDQRMSS